MASKEATKVMLAQKWDESIDPTGWWISEKLDGVRAYWSGDTFYSRQGHTFDAVPNWFKKDLPNMVLDGELWCGRGMFQKTVSIVKRQKDADENDWKYITYLIFDAPKLKGGYEERMDKLKEIFAKQDFKNATLVKKKLCKGPDHLTSVLNEVQKAGGEGLMLRMPNSPYDWSRSKFLLKVKTFSDDEAQVVGYKQSQSNPAFWYPSCKLSNGIQFVIGSGMTQEQRKAIKKHIPIGSIVTFKCQELTNKGVPRFPSFLRIRSDMNDDDWKEVCKENEGKSPSVKAKTLKKQHSILFDEKTSKEEEEEEVDNEGGGDNQEQDFDNKKVRPCKYGNECYRKDNPGHSKEFSHPQVANNKKHSKDEDDNEETKSKAKKQKTIPMCKYGAECYNKEEEHRTKYSHKLGNKDEPEDNNEDKNKDEEDVQVGNVNDEGEDEQKCLS